MGIALNRLTSTEYDNTSNGTNEDEMLDASHSTQVANAQKNLDVSFSHHKTNAITEPSYQNRESCDNSNGYVKFNGSPLDKSTAADNRQVMDSPKEDSAPYKVSFNNKLQIIEVSKIEHELKNHEKISLSFLFFDDPQEALNICEAYKTNQKDYHIFNYIEKQKHDGWEIKLAECLYLMHNFHLLKFFFKINQFDASVIFPSNMIREDRRLLYSLAEALTVDESQHLMDCLSLPNEPYLEIFLLKMKPAVWSCAAKTIAEFKNDAANNILKQLCKYIPEILSTRSDDCDFPLLLDKSPDDGLDDAYPIKDPKEVGLCFIINQMKFENLPQRKGSEKDVEKLEITMEKLNFIVETYHNKKSHFFVKELASEIMLKFKQHHSIFFMVILSHGCEGKIYATDGGAVSIEDNLCKVLQMKMLHGIPKVLIIQACQGDKFLRSQKTATDGKQSIKFIQRSGPEFPVKFKIIEGIGEYITDALIAMSTVKGFKSFRQEYEGTYFIQTLCQCIEQDPYANFSDIMTKVNREVSKMVVATKIPEIGLGQQPMYKVILRKKLYLKRTS